MKLHPGNRYTNKQKQQMLTDYLSGMSCKEVAEKNCCGQGTVEIAIKGYTRPKKQQQPGFRTPPPEFDGSLESAASVLKDLRGCI